MITLQEAINLATEAHEGQYRSKLKVFPLNEHTLSNYEISKLQQNNGTDFTICKEDGEYSMNIHLELFISKPYITHPLAVMDMMDTEEEKIIAVLHDVFRKCNNYGLGKILDNSEFYIRNRVSGAIIPITFNVYAALSLLSESETKKYDKLSTKVKIADIVHNLSETSSDYARQKYLKALPTLLKGL